MRYVLSEKGITFLVDDIIVFDCPIERIKAEPETAIKAMQLLSEIIETQKKYYEARLK